MTQFVKLMPRTWFFTLLGVAALLAPPAAWADEAPIARPDQPNIAAEIEKDVLLRALVDELERSSGGLSLEGLERPYFIEYALTDAMTAVIQAEWGALTRRIQVPSRSLRADVRVGSYVLDNTNFQAGGFGFFGRGRSSQIDVPIEDDYTAIRQALWWATDRAYKDVVEQFARKKAFMASKVIEDKPDDFSREQPAVFFEERITPLVPLDELTQLALEASAVFREYPQVQEAYVYVRGASGNKYLVNSEGTRLREHGVTAEISATATVQADDGMKLSRNISFFITDWAKKPTSAEVTAACRALAERMIALRNAPRLTESYTGPVLVSAEAAAELFYDTFADKFAGGQRPVGSRPDPDDFEKRLGMRILPRSVEVIDDPTQESINGVPVVGHYRFDDQGVPPRRVQLVEGGRLKALVMSRNPSKAFKQSTGHGQGMYGPAASIGCLVVQSTDALDAAGLKQEFLEACADEGLQFGIRIDSVQGSVPLEMYRVYPDGREELVRGAEAPTIDVRTFKRALALGDTPYVYNTITGQNTQTVAMPAILFEEVDLNPIDRDFDKPPYLPAPLAREKSGENVASAP